MRTSVFAFALFMGTLAFGAENKATPTVADLQKQIDAYKAKIAEHIAYEEKLRAQAGALAQSYANCSLSLVVVQGPKVGEPPAPIADTPVASK